MSKIKIEDISRDISSKNWKLISEIYVNLDSELHLQCPEGHQVYTSYKKWRRGFECPNCQSNPLKNLDQKIICKKPNTKRVLAIDDATTTSGWAVFDDNVLIKYGKITMTQASAVERISITKQWLASMIVNWSPDLVGIEDIQLQQFGEKNSNNVEGVTTYKVLAHLQGVLENYLFENNMNYEIVHTATWRAHCDIKGKSRTDKKKSAQLKVKDWYDIQVTQDEADAICIGKYLSETNSKKNTLIQW